MRTAYRARGPARLRTDRRRLAAGNGYPCVEE